MKVLGIAGWKNSGKTRLVERLIEELGHRNVSVSTIKHAHHAFQIDHRGTDSDRHREAGAREVLIASGHRWALVNARRTGPAPDLTTLLAKLSPVDLVLVEGFKATPILKIEVRRTEAGGESLFPGDTTIVAIVSDHAIADQSIPVFGIDDIPAIAAFVIEEILDR